MKLLVHSLMLLAVLETQALCQGVAEDVNDSSRRLPLIERRRHISALEQSGLEQNRIDRGTSFVELVRGLIELEESNIDAEIKDKMSAAGQSLMLALIDRERRRQERGVEFDKARLKRDEEILQERKDLIGATNTIGYIICAVAHIVLSICLWAAIKRVRGCGQAPETG